MCRGGDGRGTRPACPSGGLPEADVLRILRPIAAALDYAHTKGVVHRDVKPANVMIAKDGTPYILDFGIAREIQETMTRVTGKLSSGTLLYMSPEQLMGAQPNPAQDIYSFAAMVYECLKGEPPFSRGNIEFQILNKEPDPLDVPTNGPSARGIGTLAASVMAGLAKKSEDRPATCAAVLEGNVFSHVEHEERVENGNGREENPRPQRSASVPYTQTDCVRLMADAKVVKRHIARFSDDPACKKEIQEIEDDFVRADTIFAEKQWSLAAACYARIVERGKALEEGVARRAAEEKARREAEKEEKARRIGPPSGTAKAITLPGGVEMRFRWCRPGTFTMGSPISEKDHLDNETMHKVTLTRGFWMGETPVTQRQWECVMGDNPSYFKGGDRPVECVSWDECQKFIEKVNVALNCGARLPTEAEWEYACRAGIVGPYSGTGKLDEMGWYGENQTYHAEKAWFGLVTKQHPDGSHAVGRKNANDWGLYDMHGNVWEWCADWYGGYPVSSVVDPQGPSSGEHRVLRGGSWNTFARFCRSAYRFWFNPVYRLNDFGLRLCCSAGLRGEAAER